MYPAFLGFLGLRGGFSGEPRFNAGNPTLNPAINTMGVRTFCGKAEDKGNLCPNISECYSMSFGSDSSNRWPILLRNFYDVINHKPFYVWVVPSFVIAYYITSNYSMRTLIDNKAPKFSCNERSVTASLK